MRPLSAAPLAAPLAAAFAAVLTAAPALPQEDGGRSLMERGAELFFEGLRRELEPRLEELRSLAEEYGPAMGSFIEEMGPAFLTLLEEVRDWSRYEPPELLPNGDIIIRRKRDPGEAPEGGGEGAPEGTPGDRAPEDGSGQDGSGQAGRRMPGGTDL